MIWVIAALPNLKVEHLHNAPRMRVAKGLMEQVEARKRIDTRVPKTVGSSSYSPFALSELFSDTAPNQYTLWSNGVRSLYRNGDTLCLAYRRIDSRGSGYIAVAFSFDNGATWTVREDINEAAGLFDVGGRYPNCVGFYNGDPVISWPELTSGPAWGATCIAVASDAPYGYCTDPSYATYHTFAWPISGDSLWAVIGFSSNDDVIYYTYNFNTATASDVQVIRNSGTGEGFRGYDVGRYQDRALVFGNDRATGKDSYFWVNPDGTITPATAVSYYAFATSVDTIGSVWEVSVTADPNGNVWMSYILKDTLNNPGGYLGHVLVFNRADDTTGSTAVMFYTPSPSNPDSAFRKMPMYRPSLAFGPDGNTVLVTALIFPDSTNYGCPTVTGSSAPPTELIAYASTDGGANWFPADGDLIGDGTPDVMEDLYLLNYYPTNGYYVYPGGNICVTYLTPLDGTTQLHCNAAEENGVAQALIHVSCGQAVGVAEKPAKSGAITTVSVLKGGVEVSGPASIYDAKGALVATTKGGFVSLDRGVYFVKTGNRVSKVVVR